MQACPGLASEISNDPQGLLVKDRILYWVKKALLELRENNTSQLIAFLGCTHYALRESLFKSAFTNTGFTKARIINPNLHAAKYLVQKTLQSWEYSKSKTTDIAIQFISPYKVPDLSLIHI